MKKVLCVLQSKGAGAERMSLLYSKILKENGYSPTILYFTINGQEHILDDFLPRDIKVIRIKYSKLSYYVKYLFVLLKENPSIVFSSLPRFSVDALRFKKLFGLKYKVIARMANMPSTQTDNCNSNCEKWYPYADAIIAQTSEMKDEMCDYYKLDDTKAFVINNPIDKGLIAQGVKDTFEMDYKYVNFISCGQLIPRKDIETQIRAFDIFHKKNNYSRLYIIGSSRDSDYIEKMHQLEQELNLCDYIFWEGFQSNPFKYIKSADVFLLSSLDEGLPNVMLEAMYLEKPVVATSCIPYISQVINNGVNGYTVSVKDFRNMAEAMEKALSLKIDSEHKLKNTNELEIVKLFNQIISVQ